MKYLVTGGAGFIGSNFIHYLFGKYPDAEVINLDKLTYAGNLDNLKRYEDDLRYRFVKGDIADPKIVNQLVPQVDVIVNFAAESHVDRSILAPTEFVRTNVLGTQTLLEAARKFGNKRFHHISTDEVFGDLPLGSKDKFTEKTAYNPSSPYSASKAASDHLVRAYYKTYGLPITISNCSNNYGPYQFIEKFTALVIINAMQNKKLPIYGHGRNIRDWIYVEDHCLAIDLILQKGKMGETYLVGTHNEKSNLEVVKEILKLLGKSEELIEFVNDRPGHDLRYAIDPTKIERELKFKAEYDFETGLKKTIEWYQTNQDWWQKRDDKAYQEYYQKLYGQK